MADDRLVAYQNPPADGPGPGWASLLTRGRSAVGNFSHHRGVGELRDLFDLFGAGDRLLFTSSRRALRGERFFVPLQLDAYFNLSPAFAKNQAAFSIYRAISEPETRALREMRDGKVLLTLITEAFFPRQDVVAPMHEELEAWDIDPETIVLINNNLRSETGYDEACSSLGYSRRAAMVPFHGNYWLFVGRQAAQPQSDAAHTARARAAGVTVTTGQRRSTRFLSFNGKVRPHRLAFVLFLMERRLLDSGHVSLLLPRPNEALEGPELLQMLSVMPLQDELRPFIPPLLARMPLTVDIDPADTAGAMYVTQDPGFYDDTYFSVVTDTLFRDESMLFISEKPFKTILNLHPFVYLGNARALQELRALGFETFSPVIDESYDEISDHAERLMVALAEVERLARLSLDELHGMYCELWPRLVRNHELLTREAPARYRAAVQEMVWDRLGLSLFPAGQ